MGSRREMLNQAFQPIEFSDRLRRLPDRSAIRISCIESRIGVRGFLSSCAAMARKSSRALTASFNSSINRSLAIVVRRSSEAATSVSTGESELSCARLVHIVLEDSTVARFNPLCSLKDRAKIRAQPLG